MAWLLRQFRRRGLSSFFKVIGVGVVIVTLLQISTSAPNREPARPAPRDVDPPSLAKRNGLLSVKKTEQELDFEDKDDRSVETENQVRNVEIKQEVVHQHEHPVVPQQIHNSLTKDLPNGGPRAESVRQPGVVRDAESQAKSVVTKDRTNEFYENIFVHLDLKGAPPKVPYFLEILQLIAKSGATGVMLEWEDMFPYKGKLASAISTDAYSDDDVKTILTKASELGLAIVPLVQTFAHLEWILKLEEFRQYRTTDEYPQVLCLTNQEAVDLVKDSIDQVVAAHKPFGIPFFHIGCDEAFLYGVCKEDTDWIRSKGPEGSKELLALSHMKLIAEYVKGRTGSQTTILAWHDMLKNFPGQIVKKVDIGDLIEPVVWDYSEGIVTMNEWSFQTLADNFPVVWASSAYKGANFPSAKYIDVRHYETNNRAWIDTVDNNKNRFKKFHGIIITGWQRYDHMTALCEILPVGTPSMVLQVETALSAKNKEEQKGIRQRAAQKLGCSGGSYTVAGLELVNNQCNFTGWPAYATLQRDVRRTIEYVEAELEKHHPTIGWLNNYNRQHDFTQNWYLREISQFLAMQKSQLVQSANALRQNLAPLFFENTIEEIVFLTIGQPLQRIDEMIKEADRLSKLRVWPKRHFPIKKDEL